MSTPKEKSQANRAATITGDAAGSVLEDGVSSTSGLLVVNDLDKGENQVKAMKEKSGDYGKFSISTDGNWTYALNNHSKDVQALAEGETVTEKFVVFSKDGSASKTVEVTITGTNDVASIRGDTRATLTEDSHHTTARGELEVKDQDHGQSAVQAIASQAGTYGCFSIDAKGHWSYVMDNSLAATQALAQGEKGTDSFVVWSQDGSASQTVTVTLKGVNDEATITGQDSGSVSEDAAPNTATGQLIVNDVDHGENTVVPITAQAGAYGSFSIVADGSWTYTLDNSLLAVQSLPAGVTLTETFVVYSSDSQLFLSDDEHDDDEHDDDEHDSDHDPDGGDHDEAGHDDDHHAPSYKGASKVVTVTIVGTNDAAVITGSSTGAVTEDLSLAVAGQLNVSDIDTGEASFQAQSNTVGTYGSLTIGTDGVWSYALNNGADNVQALAAGETATDTFVVKSYDGTEQQMTLTLTGTNDLAIISGTSSGAVTEDTALAAGAALAVADVDHGEAVLQAQAAVAATYGSFAIGTDGNWSYALNNSAANVQALAAGEQVTDSFTATSFDGTASQLVTVTITGTNDGPVVSNNAAAATGAVCEDDTLSVTGQLSASDVDHGATQVWSVQGSADGAYGAIGIDAASGQWRYNLNNGAANVQALAAGQSQTETFTVRVTDDQGATADQQVSVTVVGSNDVASISGVVTAQVAEDSTASVGGTLTVADQDQGEAQAQAVDAQLGNYGSFSMDANGNWHYDWPLNSLDGKGGPSGKGGDAPGAELAYQARNALADGETGTDTFTVTSLDGTATQDVVVTVVGANDAASMYGQTNGEVTEDVMLGTAGTLSVQDVDHDQAHTQAAVASGNFGDFNVDADGNWTYNLAQAPVADGKGGPSVAYSNLQALAAGQAATETFVVTSLDGTATQEVSIAVVGSNDGPTGSATAALAAGTEDSAYTVSAADLLAGFSDVDNGAVLSVTSLAASHGNVIDNGNGTFTITPTANFNGSVALSYIVVDGQGGSVAASQSYTVAAVNDAPLLQGTLTEQLYASSLSVWTPFLVNNGVWIAPNGASSGDTAPHTFVRQFTAAQDGNYVFQFAVDNEGSVLVDGVAIAGLYNNDWSHSTVQTVALTAGIHTVTMNALNWGGPAAFAMNITDPNSHEIWNTRTHLDPEPLILSYTENQAAIVVSSGLTLSDIDSPTMTQATVAVGTGFAAGDVLGFADQNGITGAYDASTGVLSLSGSATQAQYQAALRSVTYSNSSDSPGTTDRTINFLVDDGAGEFNLSNTVQSKIIVMAVNDAATISGTSTGTVQEDTTLTTSGTLTVSDVDAGQAVFVAQSAAAGTYGLFSMDAAGQWTYALNNTAANVQALDTGATASDHFTVWSNDGTASQVVTVAINGLDDNQAPVAVDDTISGGVLTFESGTFAQTGSTLTTGDFSFAGNSMYTTSYYGADNSNSLYSYGWDNNNYYYYGYGYGYGYGGTASTAPITMTKTGGGTFTLESANVTTYNYGAAQTATETVTGYLNGVQVASQSFAVPDVSSGASHNNTLSLTDPGFSTVDQVVFNLSGATNYYIYQWLDNITTPNTVAQARDVNVLANDSDVDAGAILSVANFSGLSAHGAAISLNANGTLHYDPTASAELQAVSLGTNVYDSFTYQSQDEYGVLSNIATVNVTVVGVHA